VQGFEAPAGSVTRFCVECGQCLVLPTTDLAKSFRCPRCNTVHVAGSLIEHSAPIAAVPASTRPVAGVAVIAPLMPAPSPGGAPWTPQPSLDAETARGVASIREDGAQGWTLARVSRLIEIADAIDSSLYGKRARVLVAVAAAVVLTPTIVGWVDGPSWVEPLAALAFVLFVTVLAVARIAMFRDDERRWAPSIGISNLRDEITDFVEEIRSFRRAGPNQQLQTLGTTVIGAALLVLATRRVWNIVYQAGLDSWDFDWGERWDYFTLVVGGLLWWKGYLAIRREGRLAALLIDPAKNAQATRAVASAFDELPAIIDCRHAEVANLFASRAAHPLLANLLTVLGQWRPRYADAEKAYQHSLHRKLRQLVPAADPQREVPLPSEGRGYAGRVDLVLGHCVLIEMKRRLTTSSAQKAFGQIRMYSGIWRQKGPVVLLLCETDAAFASAFFESPIRELRAAGHSVVAIMAGV
jgi:hypothetical protein